MANQQINRVRTQDFDGVPPPPRALLWGAVPSATADQIKNSLLKGIDLSPGSEYQVSSRGRLNVKKALDELLKLPH